MTCPTRYVTLTSDGDPIGFYSSDVHNAVPSNAIEISEAQYQQWLLGQCANPMQRYRYVNGGLAPYNPPSPPVTPAQAYALAMQAGVAVTSTSGLIPDTSFGLTPEQQANLANVSLYIQINNRFPASQTSLPLYDIKLSVITIPTTAVWQGVASAIADYVTLCNMALAVALAPNGVWIAPSNTARIA